MKEEEMDRYIRDLARRGYNPPPEPPRDELWARIQAARQATAASAGPTSPGRLDGRPAPAPSKVAEPTADPNVIDFRSRARQIRRWSFRMLPVAALLLLAFGLGRLSLLYEGRQHPVASTPTAPPETGPARTVAPAAAEPSRVASGSPEAGQPLEATPAPAPAPRLALAAPTPDLRPRRAGPGGRTGLYRLVAAQTLGQAEMLLTSFRAETRSGGTVDPQVVTWAGDVLSSTRLLLDSPAGRDPKLRPLLEDLELVLAQIVQLRAAPAGTAGADADLIDNALQQRDIMPRLRTAVPAGAIVGI